MKGTLTFFDTGFYLSSACGPPAAPGLSANAFLCRGLRNKHRAFIALRPMTVSFFQEFVPAF